MTLDTRKRKYIKAIVSGKDKRNAAKYAGVTTSDKAADMYAQRVSKNVEVQRAIEDALAKHDLTPERAVANVGRIADMVEDKPEVALRANMTLLELQGWRKQDKPVVQVEVSDFFKNSRVIDGEVVE